MESGNKSTSLFWNSTTSWMVAFPFDKHHTQMLYCSILAIQTYTYTQGALVCSGVGFYFTATSE
jgi:hypothetical protein